MLKKALDEALWSLTGHGARLLRVLGRLAVLRGHRRGVRHRGLIGRDSCCVSRWRVVCTAPWMRLILRQHKARRPNGPAQTL